MNNQKVVNTAEKVGLKKYGFCGNHEQMQQLVHDLNECICEHDKITCFDQIKDYLVENKVSEDKNFKFIPTSLKSVEGQSISFRFSRYNGTFWSNLTILVDGKKEQQTMFDLFYCGDDVFQASFLEEVESLSGVNMRDFYQVNSVIDSSDIQRKGKFQIVSTSLKDKNGNPLFFWGRYSNGSYVDLEVGLKEDFDKCRTIFTHPYIGKLLFEDNHELEKFLDKLVHMALPEPWEFHNDKVKYSILRSYLQFTFFKLEKEDEIVQDNDKKKIQEGKSENVTMIAFNANLLSRHFEDIYIAGEKDGYKKHIFLKNPQIATKRNLANFGISVDKLVPPIYFEKVEDLLFHSEWDIELDNYEKMEHVLKRKDDRMMADITVNELKTAIEFAKRLAQRNYKFIVPMYHPKENRVQLLMPLYKTEYTEQPIGALILTPDNKIKFYVPETILTLHDAYQDARLVVRPDNAWLNPDKMSPSQNDDI